ncbi:hypothetical protein PF005_g7896 [Phytophthora fragariae]|uniref:Succinate dehydrogenase assembly factor 4, mitochondrial n=2 Tax=Phytophthora TaxID=4783 RepID=A0A6A3LCQ3_9STRA|nr:hypothetical protein PF003_g15117 [Phytophthora fragariae]KAE9041260.1 hypothetical protein PR002_g4544 [Phytophthora rubi]KAE8945014.1 hypothetical protein PF009_g5321 [Phytophthora fragariae]KAE9015828.1 hypothetical protein PF011_g7442 [Phytophthora fragariae]KAE9044579.1 hypothetical protein PR001_g5306 [Phytophthora rubi]
MAQRGIRRVSSLVAARTHKPGALIRETRQPVQLRFFSSGPTDADFVALHPSGKPHITNTPAAVSEDVDDLDDDDDVEDMVAIGPSGAEYGGPTRGGKLKEPTRFGDWERKGRCSDF